MLRFLLGVAEAGFFPGIILYLTYWFPAEYRARSLAALRSPFPLSTVIGAPVSGMLLGLDGVMGLQGWQWLFIIEGIPSVLLGIVTWFYLTDRPAKADLAHCRAEAWLCHAPATRKQRQAGIRSTLGQALASPKVMTLSLIYFGFVGALYGMQFWLPQIVKAFGFPTPDRFRRRGSLPVRHRRDDLVGAAFRCDAGACRACRPAVVSDRGRARRFRLLTDPTVTMIALIVAAIGVFCTFGVFWTLPTAWLSGTAAAGAIALINSIGNLAGFGGPYLIGWVKETMGSTSAGLLMLAVLPLIAGILVFMGNHGTAHEFAEQAATK